MAQMPFEPCSCVCGPLIHFLCLLFLCHSLPLAPWQVVDYSVVRIAQGVTHFSPGSYDSMPTCATPIPNMFMSGDWVVNDHGSFSQGKASS